MATVTRSIEMFFFPFVGGGHQIPMIDTARVFASHGVTSTIIATPSNALHFQNLITRDQNNGLSIFIHALSADIPDTDMSASPFIDTTVLLEPLRQFLLENRPDCIVVDMFHGWAGDVVFELGIARIFFNGSGCFPHCVHDNIRSHVAVENLGSDYEPFFVPNVPDRIEMTRSQLPVFLRNRAAFSDRVRQLEEKSFGTVINSFYEIEPAYADYMKNKWGKRAWIVGPVSLCNRTAEDKTERGKTPTIDEQKWLNWLNSKKPNSVLYVSFGSLARLPPEQLKEIAFGLEASDQFFIWVVGNVLNSLETKEKESENWLPEGFEERMKESGKGLVFRGWAPQLLILGHAAIKGFMTHCGWNSTLEGVSSGVPMITWPLTAEQFTNEKLITEVLKIGVQVGSREWLSWNSELKEFVGREKVELAVRRFSEEAEKMRKRVRDIAEQARIAVEKGGTSYNDVEALIHDLKARKLANQD
ncbi:hypothetical protein VNO78_12070 [Psophocarpus tetragonolobus]|uniref:Glycosyltransferase n=1 Tax=Psophocarpus tetragonolobus TaxID=3891 RepID=A0AAN9XP43_PSOTE